MTQKVFDNILITLRRNKPAYVKMCILGLGKVLIYEFNYNCINNKYESKVSLLFTNLGQCLKLNLNTFLKILTKTKNVSVY